MITSKLNPMPICHNSLHCVNPSKAGGKDIEGDDRGKRKEGGGM